MLRLSLDNYRIFPQIDLITRRRDTQHNGIKHTDLIYSYAACRYAGFLQAGSS